MGLSILVLLALLGCTKLTDLAKIVGTASGLRRFAVGISISSQKQMPLVKNNHQQNALSTAMSEAMDYPSCLSA